MYKLYKDSLSDRIVCTCRLSDMSFIPFDPANTDYQTFKAQINADEAQLEDAEGVVMTSKEAVDFVSLLD